MYMWVYMYIWIYMCMCVCVCVQMYLSKTLKIYTQNYGLWWSPTEGRKDRYSLLQTSLVVQRLKPPKLPISIHMYTCIHINFLGFPDGSVVKNPPANAEDIGDAGSIPELGRSFGEGNGYPLQYSCLGNPMDRGAWQGSQRGPWGHKNSDTT